MELTHPDDAISTLLGARVQTADGVSLGRVREVIARDDDDTATVTALVLRRGLLGRRNAELPWRAVIAIADGRVIVVPTRQI